MDEQNMTMEEYIKLEEEKARRSGRVFNWQTATYGKIRVDDDLYDLRSMEAEFPAIVIDDAFTLRDALLNPQHIDEFNLIDETLVSKYDKHEQNILYFNDLFPFNIIRPDDLKLEKDNNDNDIDIIQSSEDMAPLPTRENRHPFLRMVMEHRDDASVVVFTSRAWGRLFDTRGPLVKELILEFLSTLRFGEVVLDLDAPGLDVGSINIPYLLARYLRRFAAGRKSGAHISAGEVTDCMEVDDTWAWVAIGPERQPDAAVGAPAVVEDAPAVDEEIRETRGGGAGTTQRCRELTWTCREIDDRSGEILHMDDVMYGIVNGC
ncbi:hypothetical protein Tco_0887049 [Tanacetum coccineum]